ncbi:MAG: glycosyltransferase [Deltaproteobacteria bacterium]|nr:glycosyltransferase [Deltaproteobacteria bacterium]
MTASPLAVIIPARNEARVIGACLRSVAAQRLPGVRLEVIVIDDGSTDETAVVARGHGATVLQTGGVGPSRGRNLALRRTGADCCLFTDADCELHAGCLEALVGALETGGPGVAGVGGRQLAPAGSPPYARRVQRFLEAAGFVSDYARTGAVTTETSHNPSCCALLRRAAVAEVGGFREDLWPCEDLDLDLRLRRGGHRLLYAPEAVVYHHRPETPAAFVRMMRNYGRGHAQLMRLHGATRLLHVMPLLTLATAGLAPAAAVATAPAWLGWRLRREPGAFVEVPALTAMLAQSLIAWHRGFVEGLTGRSAIEPPRAPRALTPRAPRRERSTNPGPAAGRPPGTR